MSRRGIVIVAALALGVISGLSTPSAAALNSTPAAPAHPVSAAQTITAGPATTPVPTATTDACPGLESSVGAQLGDDFAEILLGIAEHLESGGPAIEIPSLFSRESDPEKHSEYYDVGVMILNVTGRGSQDVVVTIRYGNGFFGSSGAFVFQRCPTGKYTVHYLSTDPVSELGFDYSLVYVIPARLLPNGLTQLIVSYGNPLSGRCISETYLVVGVEAGSWRTYLKDEAGCDERDMTYVSRLIALDPDANGRRGLMLSGTRWTGWGVYPFASRPVRVFYKWQGDELVFNRRVLRPSIFRFHVLEDAQEALDHGDTQMALVSYDRAAADTTLRDSLSWHEFETSDLDGFDPVKMAQAESIARKYQTAFAHFRILALSADTASLIRLQSIVDLLALRYPEGQPGHEFAELALIFRDEFAQSGDAQLACQAVNAAVEQDYLNLTGMDGHVGNWGDEGAFTIEVVCPQL